MSYDPTEGGGVVFAGNAGASTISMTSGTNIFTFSNAIGACTSDATDTIIVNHVASVVTADISTRSSGSSYNIFGYGFSNSNPNCTGSHLRYRWPQGDDACGVLRTRSADCRTFIEFRAGGVRNWAGLDQLAGVII